MAIDSSLLYSDMAVSFILNLVGPLAIAALFSSFFSTMSLSSRVWLLIFCSAIYAFVINLCVLTFLQTTSCDGLKDFGGIAAGAGISAALALFFTWIPTVWEGLRLAISQLFIYHHTLLTTSEAAGEGVIVDASKKMSSMLNTTSEPMAVAVPLPPLAVAVPLPPEIKQGGGKRLTPEEYDDQTFSEIKAAMAYMSAFAGAYGIGIGSRYAVSCKK